MNKKKEVPCSNKGPCFGKGFNGKCVVLATPYEENQCPFQKKERFVTKGKVYPYNVHYGGFEE